MKKYDKLSLTDAMSVVIQKNNNSQEEICDNNSGRKACECIRVSVIIPTHRVSPEYKEDRLMLKVTVSEMEKRLSAFVDKKKVVNIMDNIAEVEKLIDYSHNQESLVLYADDEYASVVKLPVELKSEIVIGDRFDMRPLYKAMQQMRSYYVLTVSQQKIRLIEAVNNVLLQEFEDDNFPFINTHYYTTDAEKLMQDSFTDNLIKEFFNVADKRLQNYLKEEPLPVLLAGDVKSVSYFYEMMDDKCVVIGRLSGNYDQTPTHEILRETCSMMEQFILNRQQVYLDHIENGQSAHLLASEPREVYREASAGNADTLYIANNYSLRGKVHDGKLVLSRPTNTHPDLEELSLNIIDKVQSAGGTVIFLDDALLELYKGIVLIKRF